MREAGEREWQEGGAEVGKGRWSSGGGEIGDGSMCQILILVPDPSSFSQTVQISTSKKAGTDLSSAIRVVEV